MDSDGKPLMAQDEATSCAIPDQLSGKLRRCVSVPAAERA
ncbi:hypothetical protein ALSL_1282 [Aerosticca soli]|uniref:Uncharacterized protein n=1 Tax=Aerosticca soli TaxID=2010829 RepID=A0A2Z6E4D7_9GAMM|nr:hypothetical protein ALSL_1282 [Aerosticca soli]